jgi:glycogen synthase
MTRPLRILYAAGPGNVAGTYDHWKAGRDDPSQVAVTYSGHFYDVVRELRAEAVVISSNVERRTVRDGNIRIENRPFPSWARGGVLFHVARAWWAIRLMLKAVTSGVDVAVVSSCDHWWLLRPMRWMGVAVIPSLHCVIRAKGRTDRLSWLERRNLHFLADSNAVMAVSDEIADQLRTLSGRRDLNVRVFVPHYRRQSFDALPPPPAQRKPFRVFYAGRIERAKGVFDLLDVAKRYAAAGREDIEFDLCGAGKALDELRRAVDSAGLAARFRCHGHVQKPQMREMYGQSHLVIVPTTTDFVEGFNKVVAEAVLAGRPVITSSVCPALSYVHDAVLEVPPDDVKAYGDAILSLCDDELLYEAKRHGCASAGERFYDASRNWAETLKRVLAELHVIDSTPPRPAPAAATRVAPAAAAGGVAP